MKKISSVEKKKNSPLPIAAESTQLSSRAFALQPKSEARRSNPAVTAGHSLQSIAFPIQAKLTIGEPNDQYEQEADRVAAQVVHQINTPISSNENPGNHTQRQLDDPVQMKPRLQRRGDVPSGPASSDLESSINQARGGGQSLDANLQTSMGQAMGADFSRVKIHTDSQADSLNRSIQARAFTTGQDLFFKKGEYDPGSRSGQELIAHELTHVVQQSGNSVQRSSAPIVHNISNNISNNIESTLEPTIQRSIGRHRPQQIMEDNLVFYMKNASITPAGGIDFHKNSSPLVIFGSEEVIRQDFSKMIGQMMFIGNEHNDYGQALDEESDDDDFRFSVSINHTVEQLTEDRFVEIMDTRGMIINKLTSGIVDVFGGALGGAFSEGLSEVSELISGVRDTSTGLLSMPGQIKGPGKEIREIGQPKPRKSSKPMPKIHMVTIAPGWGQNSCTFNLNSLGVKRKPEGILIPVSSLAQTFNNALSGSYKSIDLTSSQKVVESSDSADYMVPDEDDAPHKVISSSPTKLSNRQR